MSTTIDAHGRGHNTAGPAGGQFNGHDRTSPDAGDTLAESIAEDRCRECGGANDDGEGWDGLCGWCADRAEHGRVCRECGYDKDLSRGDVVGDDSACADCARSTVGAAAEHISAAQARRELPVGQRVQTVYLGRNEARNGDPDVRTVTKQGSYEMISTRDGDNQGVHLSWAGNTAERDANGTIIVSDESGAPFVAFVPLADGADPIDDVLIRHRVNDKVKLAQTNFLPASALDTLANGSDAPAVHRAIAAHPNTDTATLAQLAVHSKDERTQEKIVQNANADSAVLDTLARQAVSESVARRIASDPRTAPPTLGKLIGSHAPSVRSAVGRNPNTAPELLSVLADSRDADVRASVASNPSTGAAVLERLSHGSGTVMAQVAKNPSTSDATLRRLSIDTSTGNQTRAMVASNPSVAPDVLERLAGEDDEWVREHAARNPSLSTAQRQALARDGQQRVRRALASNRAVDLASQTVLADDADYFVRTTLAKNPSADAAVLERMADDADDAVRANVADNPRTARSVLNRLSKETGYIGQIASDTLAKLVAS